MPNPHGVIWPCYPLSIATGLVRQHESGWNSQTVSVACKITWHVARILRDITPSLAGFADNSAIRTSDRIAGVDAQRMGGITYRPAVVSTNTRHALTEGAFSAAKATSAFEIRETDTQVLLWLVMKFAHRPCLCASRIHRKFIQDKMLSTEDLLNISSFVVVYAMGRHC